MRGAGCADHSGGDGRVAEHPGECQLRQRLSPLFGDSGESLQQCVHLVGHQLVVEGRTLGSAGDVGSGLVQIAVCEQTLGASAEKAIARPWTGLSHR